MQTIDEVGPGLAQVRLVPLPDARHDLDMATLQRKIDVERRLRDMLAAEELPEPDRIEYCRTCVRAFWDEQKLVVVVDLDEAQDDSGTA
jgi:hypothetical protein